jgi:hypothetical protein
MIYTNHSLCVVHLKQQAFKFLSIQIVKITLTKRYFKIYCLLSIPLLKFPSSEFH